MFQIRTGRIKCFRLQVGVGGTDSGRRFLTRFCTIARTVHTCIFDVAQKAFNLGSNLRRGRPGVFRDKLDAVIFRRIMTGSDHNCSKRASVTNGMGNYRSRGIPDRAQYSDSIAQEHCSGGVCKTVGKESGVVTNHDSPLCSAVGVNVTGNGGGHLADSGKGKFISHDRAPAIGSKLDHQSYPHLHVKR